MKKFLIFLSFLFVLQLGAYDKKFGIGLGGGTLVSGISGKYWLGENNAVQGIIGVRGSEGLALGFDYVMEFKPFLIENNDVTLSWYVGGGFAWWHYNSYYNDYTYELFGLNAVLGGSLRLKKVPLEFTLEWRPAFFIPSSSNKYDDGSISLYLFGTGGSVRWYF